jgi:hypothetical protein
MAKTKDKPVVGDSTPVSRNDIENKLRGLQEDYESVKKSAAGAGLAAGLGIALLLVALAFVIGRKRGKAKYAFVEIRRA